MLTSGYFSSCTPISLSGSQTMMGWFLRSRRFHNYNHSRFRFHLLHSLFSDHPDFWQELQMASCLVCLRSGHTGPLLRRQVSRSGSGAGSGLSEIILHKYCFYIEPPLLCNHSQSLRKTSSTVHFLSVLTVY